MLKKICLSRILAVVFFCAAVNAQFSAQTDVRNINNGSVIPNDNYCDQPYVVVMNDGSWVCILTTSPGSEKASGLYIISTVSRDKGRTWSKPAAIEPSGALRSYWAVPLLTPSGRIYAIYGAETEYKEGHVLSNDKVVYVYRYSDDGGYSWSDKRYDIPIRRTAADEEGQRQSFWGIDMPVEQNGNVYFAFTRLCVKAGFRGEGWVMKSDNILTEQDPSKIRFEMLPKGGKGLRNDELGTIQEEHNLTPLGNDGLLCVYRRGGQTPAHSYSRDGGNSWSTPQIMTYNPGGRSFKTPRACPTLFKTSQGKYLFWFHHNGGEGTKQTQRNPVFVSGGILKDDGFIHWSQPEILLYDTDRTKGISYPCFIEDGGRFWVTQTQKTQASVHAIDGGLLQGLWNQGNVRNAAKRGLVLEVNEDAVKNAKVNMPQKLDLSNRDGLTIDMWLRLESVDGGSVLFDSRDESGRGIVVQTSNGDEISPPADAAIKGSIRIDINDGKNTASWDVDAGMIKAGKLHHLVFIADQGPMIISVVLDAIYCDGNLDRQYGWGRYDEALGDISGAADVKVSPQIKHLRIYDRRLSISEAVGNFMAGEKAEGI